jgi:hypothetical protein
MPDYDNSEVGKDRNEPRILKDSGKANAGKDGFTTIARRIRGDLPGYFTDVGQADQYDEAMGGFPAVGGPYYGD